MLFPLIDSCSLFEVKDRAFRQLEIIYKLSDLSCRTVNCNAMLYKIKHNPMSYLYLGVGF